MLKARAQSDENEDVRQSAVQALARGWKNDPETLPILKARAQSDEDSEMRESAVRTQTMSNEHTVAEFRVIGPTRNMDAWYAGFDVKPGENGGTGAGIATGLICLS